MVALAVSQAGDWLYNVALLAFVYERTHSAAWVAATTAVRVAPVVALGPLGGVLADRFDRRRVMVASDAVRTACMLGLAAVAATGLPVVLAPVLAALATAAAAPYPPCAAASTSRLVPHADLPGANAPRRAVGTGAVAAGPVPRLGAAAPGFAGRRSWSTPARSSSRRSPSCPSPPARRSGPSRTGERQSVLADSPTAPARCARPGRVRLVGADVVCSVVYGAQTVLLLLLSRSLGYGDAGTAGAARSAPAASSAPRLAAAGRPQLPTRAGARAAPCSGSPSRPRSWPSPRACRAALLGALLRRRLHRSSRCSPRPRCRRELDDAVLARAYGIAFPPRSAASSPARCSPPRWWPASGSPRPSSATGVVAAVYAAVVAHVAAGRPAATAPPRSARPPCPLSCTGTRRSAAVADEQVAAGHLGRCAVARRTR